MKNDLFVRMNDLHLILSITNNREPLKSHNILFKNLGQSVCNFERVSKLNL